MRQVCQLIFLLYILASASCKSKDHAVSSAEIDSIYLKRGDVVLCGPPDKQFGSVDFEISDDKKLKEDFNLAVALLHSFEYDEAEKVFARIIGSDPGCAMAYWGVAMSNFHPLWSPSTPDELKKGEKVISIAKEIKPLSEKESSYIDAIGTFYRDWEKTDFRSRCKNFETAMEAMHAKFPQDKEVSIFYALALDAAADPGDKTYSKQRKAGEILKSLYPQQPDHPGIVHYLIHTYDYPGLADSALAAARKYASIAPASAHAQHMPSHIFTRLGLWDECIQSNLVSTAAAKCYAENSKMKGHWDEEMHGLDYLEYAYLQKGDDSMAHASLHYVNSILEVYPVNFKDAYAFAAIPARYTLERKDWKTAAALTLHPAAFPWAKFPWQKAIYHFAKVLGNVHAGSIEVAKSELDSLQKIAAQLLAEKDQYRAGQVEIQVKTSEAWILWKENKKAEALILMRMAADLEDATEKSPVTPGEVIPARELYGDLLMEAGSLKEALEAYRADLKTHPNRFNGLAGAAWAAEKAKNRTEAENFYQQLINLAVKNSSRPALLHAIQYLNN